jgi:hypothetical protein
MEARERRSRPHDETERDCRRRRRPILQRGHRAQPLRPDPFRGTPIWCSRSARNIVPTPPFIVFRDVQNLDGARTGELRDVAPSECARGRPSACLLCALAPFSCRWHAGCGWQRALQTSNVVSWCCGFPRRKSAATPRPLGGAHPQKAVALIGARLRLHPFCHAAARRYATNVETACSGCRLVVASNAEVHPASGIRESRPHTNQMVQ